MVLVCVVCEWMCIVGISVWQGDQCCTGCVVCDGVVQRWLKHYHQEIGHEAEGRGGGGRRGSSSPLSAHIPTPGLGQAGGLPSARWKEGLTFLSSFSHEESGCDKENRRHSHGNVTTSCEMTDCRVCCAT